MGIQGIADAIKTAVEKATEKTAETEVKEEKPMTALEAARKAAEEQKAKASAAATTVTTTVHTTTAAASSTAIDNLAKAVIEGKWGNGQERKDRLTAAGYDYAKVQARVNELLGAESNALDAIAKEVINGKWGNGQERKDRLTAAGYDYAKVQGRVNELLGAAPAPAPSTKADIETVAKEVINGKWGNGQERKDRLTAAGYDYAEVQAKVNALLK